MITVLTGAGLSTAAGIPDFRGPDGVWTRDPSRARLLELDVFVGERAAREEGWRDWAAHPAWSARPAEAHRALARLVEAGLCRDVLTQNIDGLHQAAATPDDAVVEMHGALATTSCLDCGFGCPTRDVIDRLVVEPDPRCPYCGGILKPDVVYFGEALRSADLRRASRAARTCDTFVAIGTTLQVYPVAALAGEALAAGASLVIVNASPTSWDRDASLVIRDPIEEAVPALVEERLG
ncbi:SIR2 family NAD-dependent protein deacylase [Demequina mangrovi]|uniref:protein acetyllysine N-acetyltransferase n=1 Tax=Demequina mangrovi TaxID=1043493 RepID=A0A1H6WMN7_9MICO|nr:Sir2 family NAD-dependent protein deacetylase [Demequina mangrovi]SEJ13625.1 NAD-dependent deacetylase [Demequina mangrovi]